MTASPRTCSTENWTPVIEHGEDNESGITTCKATLKSCGIPHNTWEATATDRSLWRSTCHSGLRDYEEKRCDTMRDKRKRRKAIQPSSNIDTFLCHVCARLCASRIGLHSHNGTHANTNTDWGRDPSYRRLTPYSGMFSASRMQCISNMNEITYCFISENNARVYGRRTKSAPL